MSTYIPIAIDDRAYEQAKKDAVGAYAPQNTILISGFLAGVLVAWIPGIVGIPIAYLYKRTLGATKWLEASEKVAEANTFLSNAIGTYASIAVWLGLLLGAYGILQAILRQRSCKTNKYTTLEFAKYGELRLSIDAKLTILAMPVLAVIGLWLANMLNVVIVAIVLIVLSGVIYNGLWSWLYNLVVKILFRPGWDQTAALGLRVLIPRHVGWNQVKVENVEVNRADKSVRVEGVFESEFAEKETRTVVGHFLRGYHPIYVINTAKSN